MKAIADMVERGSRVCDLGCDHGYIPIYLVEQGISPAALAMDVREGPLARAREHISRAGLEEYITLRLSDGLAGYRMGEAETLICAGMGGPLMQRILERDPVKAQDFQGLILQPQSEIRNFRRFLRNTGYSIVREDMVQEDGKFYPILGVRRISGQEKDTDHKIRDHKICDQGICEREVCDRYGPVLLREKHPVLCIYLRKEWEKAQEIRRRLQKASKGERAERRLGELELEIQYLNQAAQICGVDFYSGGTYGYN